MKSFILPFLWILLITAGSFLPASSNNFEVIKIPGLDKLVHAFFYFVLVLLLMRGMHKINKVFTKRRIIELLAGIITYGIAIELSQHLFFPSRHFEILDIIANIIGTLSGYFTFFKIFKLKYNG